MVSDLRDSNGHGGTVTLSDRVRSLQLQREKISSGGGSSKVLVFCMGLLVIGFAASSAWLWMEYINVAKELKEAKEENSSSGGTAEVSRDGSKPLSGGSTGTTASSGDIALHRKGYIIPAHQILVSPKVGGMIEELYIEEGKKVNKGDILAQVERTDYRADFQKARAMADAAWSRFMELYRGSRDQEVRQAKAELEEMDAQKEQLYSDWKRNNRLQGASALATREHEQAQASYKAMDKRVEKLKQSYSLMLEGPREEKITAAYAEWEQAEAEEKKAKWRLDNTSVRAPVSGTILTKRAELGNLVNPLANQGSFSLCEMADLAELEVDLNIEERDIAKVFAGQKCRVSAEAYPERVYEGVVARLMPTADRGKSAIPVRVKLIVPSGEEGIYMKPEMGAQVTFLKPVDKAPAPAKKPAN